MFKKVLERWISGVETLHVYVPNHTKIRINTKKCLSLDKEIGFNYFERLYIPATTTDPKYLTPVEHLVTDTTIKRMSQSLAKKISASADDTQTDLLTQQARGDSDSAAISYPELQLLAQTGLSKTAAEFVKDRGGDAGVYRAMVAQLEATGKTDQETIHKYSTGVQSKATLHQYLNAIHIVSNL